MKVLITAGPMRSKIDPIRFVQNSSSGQLALELAKSIKDQSPSSELEIILGPVDSLVYLQFQEIAEVFTYETSDEYKRLLLDKFPDSDLFISAAAVLDYEVEFTNQKKSRDEISTNNILNLQIRPVEDFAAMVGEQKKPHQKILSFSLDTRDATTAIPRALEKMKKKNSDWILLNYANKDSGPEKAKSTGMLLSSDEKILTRFEKETKAVVANEVIQYILSGSTEEKLNEQSI